MSTTENKALDDTSTLKSEEVNLQDAEKEEEAKLKAKYPQAMRPGGSNFLQKRLNRGQKYFDSGDYNMAKAKGCKPPRVAPPMAAPPPAAPQPQPTTGDTIPTPDIVMSRKTSLVQSKLATGLS